MAIPENIGIFKVIAREWTMVRIILVAVSEDRKRRSDLGIVIMTNGDSGETAGLVLRIWKDE